MKVMSLRTGRSRGWPFSSSGAFCVDRVDAVVIGAGVVGLAVARALATAGREVVILEAEDAIGTHTSSRNSEVIHAGIYYPQGSLKARACVEGRRAPVRLLRRARSAAPALRQVDRRHRRRATGGAGGHPTESTRQRRHRCRAREPGASSRDGTGVALRGGPALALDGDHRQPRPDARLPGRCRTRGCDARVEEPACEGRGARRRHRVARRGRRTDPCRAGGEQRGTAGAEPRAAHRRLPRRARAARALRQRQLLLAGDSARRSRASSTRCPSRGAWACT